MITLNHQFFTNSEPFSIPNSELTLILILKSKTNLGAQSEVGHVVHSGPHDTFCLLRGPGTFSLVLFDRGPLCGKDL